MGLDYCESDPVLRRQGQGARCQFVGIGEDRAGEELEFECR
jgi:hypothetical protein